MGLAQLNERSREIFRLIVESYLSTRGTLVGVVVLVDVRRGLEEEEHALLDFVTALDVPALVVATKIDKLTRAERTHAERALAAAPVPVVAFSAVTGEGVDEVWRAIATWTRGHKR